MAKRLLIMALVAVQCASWSGASLFLCLGADGSVCIDQGPDSCTCCRTEHAGHDACCGGHHHDAQTPADSQLAGDPCDCTHVQISQAQAPSVVVRPATKFSLERAADFFAAAPIAALSQFDGCSRAIPSPRGGPSLAPSLALTLVAVAVRTC